MRGISLRWQMTLAMGIASLAAALFIVIALVIYVLSSSTVIFEGLPANEAGFVQDAAGERPPDVEEVFATGEEPGPWSDLVAVILIALGGSAIGGLVGYRFARRISQPIEALATTARTLSTGLLSTRTQLSGRHSSEITKLIREFNFMAAELDKAECEKAEVASAIAHELRTPVTILRGRLQGFADGVFEVEKGVLESLIAQTEILSQIIDDLRTLTLAHTGQLEMSPCNIDLATQARAVLEAVKPLIEETGLEVHMALNSAPAHADPVRLRQAIGALIENARRYGSDGGEISIEAGNENGFAFVRVMDRGPGLGAEEAERVFDRFWRVDISRSRRFGGSGLGLAVVRSICQGHGGDVSYTDRHGGGAVFQIAIPANGRALRSDQNQCSLPSAGSTFSR